MRIGTIVLTNEPSKYGRVVGLDFSKDQDREVYVVDMLHTDESLLLHASELTDIALRTQDHSGIVWYEKGEPYENEWFIWEHTDPRPYPLLEWEPGPTEDMSEEVVRVVADGKCVFTLKASGAWSASSLSFTPDAIQVHTTASITRGSL